MKRILFFKVDPVGFKRGLFFGKICRALSTWRRPIFTGPRVYFVRSARFADDTGSVAAAVEIWDFDDFEKFQGKKGVNLDD